MSTRKRRTLAIIAVICLGSGYAATAEGGQTELKGKLVLRCNNCFNPDHKGIKHTPFVRLENTSNLIELNIAEQDIPKGQVGKKVKVRGNLKLGGGTAGQDMVETSSIVLDEDQPAAVEVQPAQASKDPEVAGAKPATTEHKCLLIFANATDWTFPAGDKTSIANVMVNNSRNADLCYRSVSRDHMGIVLGKDTNDSGMVTVDINLPASANWNGYEADMVIAAAALGYNEADYDHVLCFIPSGASLMAPAYANIYGKRSIYTWGRRTRLETIVHEIGHNLGFYHANEWNHSNGTSQEYGDSTCIMGPSPQAANSAAFNPVKQDLHGWFDFHTGSLPAPTNDVTVNIYPNALSLDTDPSVRAVKVAGEFAYGSYYYSYYTAYLKEMDPYGLIHDAADENKLIIYRGLTHDYSGAPSDQWQNLGPGESYSINGTEITFEIRGDSTGSYAIASFDFADGNAKPVADAQSVTTKLNNATSITLTGSDADLESITISLATSPSNGLLSGTAPNLIYTPNTNYIGSDAFAFSVDDGKIRSYAWVTIDVTAPSVSVAATDADASEEGQDTGVWTFTRTGDISEALDLAFSLGGTANSASDYTLSATNVVTMPAGQTNTSVTLTPIDDALFLEHSETATLTLSQGANYILGNASDTITITDNDNNAPIVDAGDDQIALVDSQAPWSPANRPTAAWFDANDTNTVLLNGGNVSDWLDKSGNNNHAVQVTGSAQPQYLATDPLLNGMGSIYSPASGAGDYLLAPAFGAKRIYGIMYYGGGTNAAFDSHNAILSGPGSGDEFRLTGRTGQTKWDASSDFCDDNVWKNGDDTSDARNSILPMPATMWVFNSTALRTQTWRIMAGSATSWSCWMGGLGELVFTDGTEDAANRQKIEGYLAHKWGIEGTLPTNHPYKAAPPTGSSVTANLDGTVTDADGETPAVTWTMQSGPDAVLFGDSGSVDTTAMFPSAGVYVLRLTADDGSDVVYDEVTVTVSDGPTGVTSNHSVPHAWLDGMNGTWSNDYETAVMTDQDGDGFTTWQEYWCGTDPTNGSSYLRIDAVSYGGTNVVIEWQHAAIGAAIPAVTIEAASDLTSGSWTNVGAKTPVNGTNLWSTTSGSGRYYRLGVAAP